MHPAICPEQRLPVKKLHAIALETKWTHLYKDDEFW